jgi:hypothetical protein
MSDEPKPNAASEDPKSLQNGLGLDTLLAGDKPITKPSKPSSKTDKVVEKVVEAKVGKPESKPDAKGDAEKEPDDLATLSKRLKDTRDYATKVDQKNKDLERSHASLLKELETVKARLDGTYVEPPQLDQKQQTEIEKFKARVEADNAAVMEQYGVDTVQKLIWENDSPYMKLEAGDPSVLARMQSAKRPVMEAMKIVEEHQFFEKYGRDPLKIKDAIIAEAREELIAELKQELKGKPIETVNNLSGVTGAPREINRAAPKVGAIPDLAKVFPTFHSTTPS